MGDVIDDMGEFQMANDRGLGNDVDDMDEFEMANDPAQEVTLQMPGDSHEEGDSSHQEGDASVANDSQVHALFLVSLHVIVPFTLFPSAINIFVKTTKIRNIRNILHIAYSKYIAKYVCHLLFYNLS